MLDGKVAGIAAVAFVAGAVIVFAVLGLGGPAPDHVVSDLTTSAGLSSAPMTDASDDGGETDAPDNPVVATIDGTKLRLSELETFKQMMAPQFANLPIQMVYDNLLEQAINGQLMAMAGRKEGLQGSRNIRRQVTFIEDRLIQEAFVEKLAAQARQTQSVDAEVQRRYQVYLESAKPEEEIHARHILFKNQADAVEVIRELALGGDFETLAKQRSIGPSAERGGDLGYFSRNDMVPEFSEAAFKLNVGEYTKAPVQTQFGWHVITVVDRREKPVPTLEEKRESLIEQIAQEYVASYIEKLRMDATIERFNVDGTPVEQVGVGGDAPATNGDMPPAGETPPGDQPPLENAPEGKTE